MRKSKCDFLGLSLLISAFLLTFIFLITCIKKRNLLAAIAAVAAINAAGGWYLLRRNRKKNGEYLFDFFTEPGGEFYNYDKFSKARSASNEFIRKCREMSADCIKTAPVCEIPVDEETTEEDFINDR